MKRTSWLSILLLAIGAPALASAADGYVVANVNLRAGPDISYPRIDTLPAGVSVNIYGCTDGWDWCDIGYRGDRGWVAGNYIEYYQDDRPLVVADYGPQIGIPIVTFVIGTYWGQHYSHRPFYRERNVWYRRPAPHRPPPPPPRHPWHRPGTPAPGRPAYRPNPGHDSRPNPSTRPPSGDRPNPGMRPPVDHRPAPTTRPQPATRPQPRPVAQPPQARPAPRPAAASHPTPSKNDRHGKPARKGHDERDKHGR